MKSIPECLTCFADDIEGALDMLRMPPGRSMAEKTISGYFKKGLFIARSEQIRAAAQAAKVMAVSQCFK
jgi:hypothetical protein